MQIEAQFVIQNGQPLVGHLDVVWTTNDLPPNAGKVAIRYVTPVTPDNELGYKEVNAYTPATRGHARPGGFPSGQRIILYAQAQTAEAAAVDVGLPSNPVDIVVP